MVRIRLPPAVSLRTLGSSTPATPTIPCRPQLICKHRPGRAFRSRSARTLKCRSFSSLEILRASAGCFEGSWRSKVHSVFSVFSDGRVDLAKPESIRPWK